MVKTQILLKQNREENIQQPIFQIQVSSRGQERVGGWRGDIWIHIGVNRKGHVGSI